MAALVALGPLLVLVGIGMGIYAIEQDSAGMVFTGLGIAFLGLVLTIVAFVVMRVQASAAAKAERAAEAAGNASDTDGPAT